ncbi:hypothetical protein Tco_0352111 [Tanacetum coccineum]
MRSLRLLSHRILGSPHHTPQLHQTPPHHYPLVNHSLRQHPSLRFPDLCTIIGPHVWLYISSSETPSPSSSLTLPIRKRNQDTSELVEDTEDESSDSDTKGEDSDDEGPGSEDEGPGSEDEGPGSDKEEAAPEGEQQAVPVMDTTADKPLGLGYEVLRRQQQRVEETLAPRPPVRTTWVDPMDDTIYTDIPIYIPQVRVPVQESPSPEWSSGSLPVSPSSPAVPTPVASPTTTPAATIAVDEDALPPTLFEGYDRDLRELYTSLRAVRDEIFSQHYRLRSLEQEQEKAIIWRLVLALESWVGHVDAQRAEMCILLTRRGLDRIRTPDQDLVRPNLRKNYRTVETVERPTIAINPGPLLLTIREKEELLNNER